MSNLGMGVMLGILGGNSETVDAIKRSLGRVISSVRLVDSEELRFTFEDGGSLTLWDGGQSCCESRYMNTSDDLASFAGATLLDLELKEAPNMPDDHGDEHEVQFLDVKTSKGVFQMASHNEHNGYYGGFYIKASASLT